jgi:ABC-type Fe3+-hydroxamate transport system substrate-binding protein
MKISPVKSAAAVAAAAVLFAGSTAVNAGDKTATTISAGKLAKSHADYVGRTVTVSAEVEDFLGTNMFTLDEDSILSGPDVLVLVPGGLTANLTHDQKVTVTGEVRRYVEADLDRDFDFFENGKLVDVKTKVDWNTRPVLVARSIRTADGASLMKGAVHTASTTSHDTTMHSATGTSIATPLSAGKLAREAKNYYGKTVTVRAEVEDVLGTNMFTLDEDSVLAGSDVLVLVPRGVASGLKHDQKVVVTGQVRPFVEADLDRDFDWFDNGKLVDVKTKVDWKTRPVIVAETVRTDSGTDIVQR